MLVVATALAFSVLLPQGPDPYASLWPRLPADALVEVVDGEPWKPPTAWPLHARPVGLLRADTGDRFRVSLFGVGERTFRRATPVRGTRVEPVAADPRPIARAMLAALRQGTAPPVPAIDAATCRELCELAAACERAGERQLATDLASLACALGGASAVPLPSMAAIDVLWNLMLDIGRREVPWWELAARAEMWAHLGQDDELVQRLQPLLRGLARHARSAANARPLPADASVDRRIADAVRQLREQCGVQVMQPGACDPWLDALGAQSPAELLCAFGEAALPQVLAALDDDAPTRCITYHRNFHFSHRPITIGELAREVFERITGVAVRSRAEAQDFLDRRQGRDLLDVWFDGARTGNLQHADRLLAKDGARTLVALTQALAERPADEHAELLRRLSGVDDPSVADLLREVLRTSPSGNARAVAAVALALRGDTATALDGLLVAWRSGDLQVSTPEVARVLLSLHSVAALRAVAEQPDRWERTWFEWLGSGSRWALAVCVPGGGGRRGFWHPAAEDGYGAAVDDVLQTFAKADASEPTGRVAQRVRWAEGARTVRGAPR